jgi:hypothetical protein
LGKSQLLQREAKAIAKKLNAEVTDGGNHEIAAVFIEGVLIATYGIRRDRKATHPYIAKQLFISETQAMKMATCTISKEQYVTLIRQKGKID